MLLLYLFSQTCWWKSVLHKDEDGLLSTELDSLPHNVDKLPNCKISRDAAAGRCCPERRAPRVVDPCSRMNRRKEGKSKS